MRNSAQPCEWALVAGPVQEPLSLDEAKRHAVVHQDDDNGLVQAYITAARQAAESYLGRGLFTQTWIVQIDGFYDIMWLPNAAPLQNSASPTDTRPVVQYYDDDGNLQTLASSYYTVDTTSTPGRIVRAPNQTWPSTQSDRLRPVLITYVVGWESVDDIPELIKQGLRLYVAGCEGDRVGETDRRAAEACWTMAGQVFWREPSWC